jgi:hypothetical protein
MQALVAGPASSFHLNYHRVIDRVAPGAQLLTAKLWWNAVRQGVSVQDGSKRIGLEGVSRRVLGLRGRYSRR